MSGKNLKEQMARQQAQCGGSSAMIFALIRRALTVAGIVAGVLVCVSLVGGCDTQNNSGPTAGGASAALSIETSSTGAEFVGTSWRHRTEDATITVIGVVPEGLLTGIRIDGTQELRVIVFVDDFVNRIVNEPDWSNDVPQQK